MAKWGSFNFSGLEKLRDNLQKAVDGAVIEQFIRDFVTEIGMRALRKIKKRMTETKPDAVNSGELRRAWKVRAVSKNGDDYMVEIFNNLEYASFVEHGFRAHWVPGKWEGNSFRYIKDYKPPKGEPGGMQVGPKNGWVEGRFMMTISMQEIERELPQYLERRQKQLIENMLKG